MERTDRDIWKEYTKHRDYNVKKELMIRYVPLVKYIVDRISISLPDFVDINDLISSGTLGLLDAIDSFNPNRGVKFETYATLRIKGAIYDDLRSLDWVPRSVRQKQKLLERTIERMEAATGRAPQDEEVAKELGIDLDEYYRILMNISFTRLLSLDQYAADQDGEGLCPLDRIEGSGKTEILARMEKEETKNFLANALAQLPEKEKLVVLLYYYEELTLKEISKVMNLSESRISQIHAAAMVRLRGKIRRLVESTA